MRCLYCGKELALFKRLRGGEFCSEAHRLRYQEEYTELALNRLLQANSSRGKEMAGAKPQQIKPAELESPALKRREKLGRAEGPVPLPALSTPPAPAFASVAKPLGIEESREATPRRTAVLDPEPASVPIPALVEKTQPLEVSAPVAMSAFLVEFPAAAAAEAAAIPNPAPNVEPAPGLALPRAQEFRRETRTDRLEPAGRVALSLFKLTDFQTPPRERGLELREFAHGAPQVEIRVPPASDTGLEPVRQALDVKLDARVPEDSPRLHSWAAPEKDPANGAKAEILLGELARLNFALTRWDEGRENGVSVEQPPAVDEIPEAITQLEPLHFEPVHIDPVFIDQIAGTAESSVPGTAMTAQPAAPVPTPPAPPPTITKPMPVTLHGLSPARGEPAQVFTSAILREPARTTEPGSAGWAQVPGSLEGRAGPVRAVKEPARTTEPGSAGWAQVPGSLEGRAGPVRAVKEPARTTEPGSAEWAQVPGSLEGRAGPVRAVEEPARTTELGSAGWSFRSGDVQVPRSTGLPLRPTMVLGPALKTANAPAPATRETRSIEIKPRKSEVRILPVQVKEETLPRLKEPTKQAERVKPQPASKPDPVPAAKEKTPAEKPKPTPPRAEIKKPAAPAPAEEPDLLGLPKLSYQHSESFWSRLPVVVRIGAIAAVLALIVGGAILVSRGSAAPKTAKPPENPQVVEAGTALANTEGWMQDWFTDGGSKQPGRRVDVLRGSLTLRDYRLLFEGQIERGALGWVFRANDKSFYVEKIQVITPGLEPVVALVHFAVINGQEQPRTQVPLPIKARLDTTYKVRMDAVGSRFTTWVQEQKVDEWSDSQIDAGGVGLYYDSGDSAKLKDTLNVIPLKDK